MADSITEAVLGGVAGMARNTPERVTIKYSAGHELVLRGDTLRQWWAEYLMLFQANQRMSQLINGPQLMPSEEIHELFKRKEKAEKTEKKEKTGDEEE